MTEYKQDVAQSVESGEYYRDALRWYGTMYHSPISERALLIIITVIALIITMMAMIGLFMMMPLTETKPMIVRVGDSLEKVARVEKLMDSAENADDAVLEWFISDFIKAREEYDIDRQQSYFRRVYALSDANVYHDYVGLYRGSNSPTLRYERHTSRKVEISAIEMLGMEMLEQGTGSSGALMSATARVRFLASEMMPTEERNSIWQADITFRFSKIHVDQVTGAITPMEFKVAGYESKQLGLE